MKKALLVIDVQKYFLKDSRKDLPTKIASHIRQSNYDFVAFTVFRNLPGSNWEKSLHWSQCQSDGDLVLPKEFDGLANSKNTFEKHSYSAFNQSELLKQLKAEHLDEINLCGIDLECCVLATAFDAFDKDYAVKVMFDLSYSRDGWDEAAKSIMTRNLQSRN